MFEVGLLCFKFSVAQVSFAQWNERELEDIWDNYSALSQIEKWYFF